jgi:hypothetical protein
MGCSPTGAVDQPQVRQPLRPDKSGMGTQIIPPWCACGPGPVAEFGQAGVFKRQVIGRAGFSLSLINDKRVRGEWSMRRRQLVRPRPACIGKTLCISTTLGI